MRQFRNFELEEASVDAGYCLVTMHKAHPAVVPKFYFYDDRHPDRALLSVRGVLFCFVFCLLVTVGEWSL